MDAQGIGGPTTSIAPDAGSGGRPKFSPGTGDAERPNLSGGRLDLPGPGGRAKACSGLLVSFYRQWWKWQSNWQDTHCTGRSWSATSSFCVC